jgi:SAM-dependent methyltransferase
VIPVPIRSRLLYATTVFASGFLLFIVQPLIARQILPWFGGTGAVWTICLVFFQVVLVAGYAYANWSTRRLSTRGQSRTHMGLLAVSLLSLPIVASAQWKPTGSEEPTLRILGLLLFTIGLPYFVLCTTGPLLQAWFARAFPQHRVYRLFALSNLASLAALASYPFAIEPRMTTTQQAYSWSVAYALFALLCGGVALAGIRRTQEVSTAAVRSAELATPVPVWKEKILWMALPAMGTWLLLAVTNHITQNLASIPFLWLLPLTLYLGTFIICFDHERWYRRGLFVAPALALLGVCAYGLQTDDVTLNVKIAVPLYASGLFFWCLFCHGELARLKPAPRDLTTYYLMIAIGGALGGLVVGLVAPRVLVSSYELGVGLTLTAVLATAVLLRGRFFLVPAAALGVAVVCGYFTHRQIHQEHSDAHLLERSFYGTLRTEDTGSIDQPGSKRRLVNGVIMHGEQYLEAERRHEPISYYGPTSGIGIVLRLLEASHRRVGVIGLGTGSLAAYGRQGDVFQFYDINPQVVDLARREFTFLRDSLAMIAVTLGDARLTLEREPSQSFDVLAIDAFSSDSIPIHLMTKEALAVYLKHMKPGGVMAFHVSNRFFDLAPIVMLAADAYGLSSALIVDNTDDPDLSKSDWVLVTSNRALLEAPELAESTETPDEIPGLRAWTDDDHNLFQVLK